MTTVHKKIQVVIFYKNFEKFQVLLLKTNKMRGEYYQNVTGSVELNEEFIEAAKREVKEETGLDIKSDQLIELPFIYNFKDRWIRDVEEKTFLLQIDRFSKITIDPNEHIDYKWEDCQNISLDSYKYENNFQTFQEGLKLIKLK